MTLFQILLNLLFAALSAFLGVLMGIWYSKKDFKTTRAAEKIELRHKLLLAFRFNIKGLEQMEKQLTPQQGGRYVIPDYRLDTESISHILFHGRELFDDESWFEKFNWQRYQLTHINAKVDFLNEITNLSDFSLDSISAQGEVGQQRYNSLLRHLKISQKEIVDLISDYEKIGKSSN
jgi:hypothetical protein